MSYILMLVDFGPNFWPCRQKRQKKKKRRGGRPGRTSHLFFSSCGPRTPASWSRGFPRERALQGGTRYQGRPTRRPRGACGDQRRSPSPAGRGGPRKPPAGCARPRGPWGRPGLGLSGRILVNRPLTDVTEGCLADQVVQPLFLFMLGY